MPTQIPLRLFDWRGKDNKLYTIVPTVNGQKVTGQKVTGQKVTKLLRQKVTGPYVFTKLSSHSCNLWLLKLSNKYQMLVFLFRCIHIVTFCPTYIRYMNQGIYTYCDFLSYLHTVHESRYIYIYIVWLLVLPTYRTWIKDTIYIYIPWFMYGM
jgi:hypothetical protein